MIELVVRAPQALVEPTCDALLDSLGALSVAVEDAEAGSAGEQALFGEPGEPAPRAGWQLSTLSALFADEPTATDAAAWLLAQGRAEGLQRFAHEAANLALAKMALPRMLMVDEDGRKRAITMRDQQVSRERLTFGARVRDPAPAIANFGFLSVHGKIDRVSGDGKL